MSAKNPKVKCPICKVVQDTVRGRVKAHKVYGALLASSGNPCGGNGLPITDDMRRGYLLWARENLHNALRNTERHYAEAAREMERATADRAKVHADRDALIAQLAEFNIPFESEEPS